MAALDSPRIVFLALGSNQGDRLALLREAVRRFAPEIQVVRCSSIYETPPWGYLAQPPFFNAVVQALTALSPRDLLHYLKGLEQALGRVPGPRYGPRPIDLDILLYDQIQVDDADLTIPHPRIAERSFVLAPLAELEPELRLNEAGPRVSELLAAQPDRQQIRRVADLSLL